MESVVADFVRTLVTADEIIADSPEKESAGEVVEQDIGKRIRPKQCHVDGNADENSVRVGDTCAKKAKTVFIHFKQFACYKCSNKKQNHGKHGQCCAIKHVQQAVLLERLNYGTGQKWWQRNIGDKSWQKLAGGFRKPAKTGQDETGSDNNKQAENASQSMKKGHVPA